MIVLPKKPENEAQILVMLAKLYDFVRRNEYGLESALRRKIEEYSSKIYDASEPVFKGLVKKISACTGMFEMLEARNALTPVTPQLILDTLRKEMRISTGLSVYEDDFNRINKRETDLVYQLLDGMGVSLDFRKRKYEKSEIPGNMTFSVEFEVVRRSEEDYHQVAVALGKVGTLTRVKARGLGITEGISYLTERDYFANPSNSWEIKLDAPNLEVTTPILPCGRKIYFDTAIEEVEEVTRSFRETGCQVDAGCGLHVHIGNKEGEWPIDVEAGKRLLIFYAKNEADIDKLMPQHRRDQAGLSYRPIAYGYSSVNEAIRVISAARTMQNLADFTCNYHGVKKIRFHAEYNTLEFRHYHATLDEKEVSNWVKCCIEMVRAARRGEEPKLVAQLASQRPFRE